jgi:diketogulonate reductase-like aldo/keto reductase
MRICCTSTQHRTCLALLGICTRADIFVTSKLWNTFHAREHVRPACEQTLKDLGLDYIDLYLIHFPIALKFVPFEKRYPPEWIHDPKAENPKMEVADVPLQETWKAMEGLVDAGLARHIGVSNFNCQTMMDLMRYARIQPAANQVELHPYLVQNDLVEYCASINVSVTAYSPLGAGSYVSLNIAQESESVLTDPAMEALAKKHGKSVAQIALRWGVQRGCTVIPKSSKPERILENASIFDFELSQEDMEAVTALNRNRRFNDPGVYTRFFKHWYPIFG